MITRIDLTEEVYEEYFTEEDIKDKIFYRKTFPDGSVEEKYGSPANYYVRKWNPTTVRHECKSVFFCPKCGKIMTGYDTKVYQEYGCCGPCEAKINIGKPPVGMK